MFCSENSNFKPYGRAVKASVHCLPPLRRILANVTGGLAILYRKLQTSELTNSIDFNLYTDKDGNFYPVEGMPLLAGRYRFVDVLGCGQSSVVLKAKDTFLDDKDVAIKVLKLSYGVLGAQEAGCLIDLNSSDPLRFAPILRVLNVFWFGRHYCMVFELLQNTSLMKLFSEIPSSKEKLICIRKVALRLLNAVGFLQSRRIIHADLKPENLLLGKANKLSSLKVVDFGNAFHCVHDEMSLYYEDFELQTLIYRAPEVIFGLMFGTEVDMWSIGCILAELFTGSPLFYGPDLESILLKMQMLLGPLPQEIFQRGKFYPRLEKFTKWDVEPLDITKVMRCLNCSDFSFVDFLLRLLNYDPASRITVTDAAQHPFLAPEVGVKYLTTRKAYDNVPKSDEICRYSIKKNKPRNLVSASNSKEFSFVSVELPEYPDILRIAMKNKVLTEQSDDSECLLNSETNPKSRSPKEVNGNDILLRMSKLERKDENIESSAESTTPMSERMSVGQTDVEGMEPVRRTRVQRSSDRSFSSTGTQELKCDLQTSRFHTPKTDRSNSARLETPVNRSSTKSSKLNVAGDDVGRRRSGEDSSAVETDVSKPDSQKKNIRELKSLLHKILLNSPVRSTVAEDDERRVQGRCGHVDLNVTFVRPSLGCDVAEELPEIINVPTNRDSSLLKKRDVKIDCNSNNSSLSKKLDAGISPSQTANKVSQTVDSDSSLSKKGHLNKIEDADFSETFAATPSANKSFDQIESEDDDGKCRRTVYHSGKIQSGRTSKSQKDWPGHNVSTSLEKKSYRMETVRGSSLRETDSYDEHFKLPLSFSVKRNSSGCREQKRGIEDLKRTSAGNEKSQLNATFLVEEPADKRPASAPATKKTGAYKKRPQQIRGLTPDRKNQTLELTFEPSTKSVSLNRSFDVTSTRSRPNHRGNSVEDKTPNDELQSREAVVEKTRKIRRKVKKSSTNCEPKKSKKRKLIPNSSDSDKKSSVKRRKVNAERQDSDFPDKVVPAKRVFSDPRQTSSFGIKATSDFSRNLKVTPSRNSLTQSSCNTIARSNRRSSDKATDLNETFVVDRNDLRGDRNKVTPSRRLAPSGGNDGIEVPRKTPFGKNRYGQVDEFVLDAGKMQSPDRSASESDSDNSDKSGYANETISTKKTRRSVSLSSDSDSAKSGYTFKMVPAKKGVVAQRVDKKSASCFSDGEDSGRDEVIMLTP